MNTVVVQRSEVIVVLSFQYLFYQRLSKKEAELLDEKSSKVSEWGAQAALWKEWLKKKEDELESQGAVGTEPSVVKKQKADLEVSFNNHARITVLKRL